MNGLCKYQLHKYIFTYNKAVEDMCAHILTCYLQELEADKTMYEEKVKSISDHANKMIDSGHFESAKIRKTVKSFCDRCVLYDKYGKTF